MRRALFLDRDGVVNREVVYLHKAEEVRWVDGIFSLCRTARLLGYTIIVVTNQAGIARGYYTQEDFDALTVWMRTEMEREGAAVDAVYSCPYHPEHGVGEYRREHEDRKPGPGMLRRGEKEFGVELSESVMVGDRCSDIEAGMAAGILQNFLLRGMEGGCGGDFIAVDSLAEVEQWLVENS